MRLGKIFLVLGMGLFMTLAAFNNTLTFQGTFNPVNGVVGMQGTFQHPMLMWRAIETPFIVWMGVIGIIITEYIAGLLCLWGAAKMWSSRNASNSDFKQAKSKAMLGLSLVAVFYFIAFQVVAGEWFMLWQNRTEPTLQEAFRNFASAMLMLIWINTADE